MSEMTPGRAAYEVSSAVLDKAGAVDGPAWPWDKLPYHLQAAWDAAAQAAIASATVEALRRVRPELSETDEAALRERLAEATLTPQPVILRPASELGWLRTDGESDEDTRQRLGRERDSLAGRVDGLVSKAGELREERDRLADALAGNPDPLVSALQSQVEHFRELIAEILDALDHGGPYWAEEWRARAGLEG